MIVSARPAPGRAFYTTSFEDITPVAVVGVQWNEAMTELQVEFADDLAPNVADSVRWRLMSSTPEREALRGRLAALSLPINDPAAALADLIELILSASD